MAEEEFKKENHPTEEQDMKETTTPVSEPTGEEVNDGEHIHDHEGKKKKLKKDKKDLMIEELTTKLEELSDKHLRLQAEFDNFRRRTLKEKADLIKSGGETVLIHILPVIDDFERALGLMSNIPDEDADKQGTILIYNKFTEFLKRNNVREIDAMNQIFDVDLHEAITKIPAPDESLKGKVVDVVQKGYTLNEKVIRFAKVVIG